MTRVFVFGSNLAGRHGKGAALHALKNCGAIYGQGVGYQGNSYGIPTKDFFLNVLPVVLIETYVDDFVRFTKDNPSLRFQVTRVGCGLAGYSNHQIAPLFKDAINCEYDPEWVPFLT